jgi:hypothetical protein
LPKQFVDFGTRGSVDMALSRLAHAGDIRRIGRGLYDYPRQHDKLGALSPDPGQVAQALSAQSGDALAPSGAAAANSLGLSTQVPARASYATSGRTRTAKAGGRSVTLKHSRAPVLDAPESAIVQALAHLGRAISTRMRSGASPRGSTMPVRVRSSGRPAMPGWMGDIVLKIQASRRDRSCREKG